MSSQGQMRFCILGSGSEGNCALLQTPHARVLIDAGFSARRTSELLSNIGESLERIDAIFITHEHGDHASALSGLAKHTRIKVFANAPTARVVQAKLKHKLNWQIFETGTRFDFLDLSVESFTVPHDAQEPVGFLFSEIARAAKKAPHSSSATGDVDAIFRLESEIIVSANAAPAATRTRSVAWLTDLGHTPHHIHERIRRAEVLVVEANHCTDLLQRDSKRPWAVKQRISGRHGHLSNQAARALLEAVESPLWRQIYLTHLSRDCNSAEAIMQAFAGIDTVLKCPFSVVPPGTSTAFYEFD